MLELNGTLLVVAISFIVFLLIMQKIFYAPMTEVRGERARYIENNNNLATKSIEETENLTKNYNVKIATARTNANKAVIKATDQANKKKQSKLEESSQLVSVQIDSARENILKDKNNAIDTLKPQIISLAQSISSKVLGEEIPLSGVSPEMIDRAMNR